MVTITLPTEDAKRIAYVLGDYALENFNDAEAEAARGNDDLLRECSHLNYLAYLIDPSNYPTAATAAIN